MCALDAQLSYHKFNESQREQTVLKRLKEREIVALISDAGTPGISDPGTEMVRLLFLKILPLPASVLSSSKKGMDVYYLLSFSW